MLRSILRIGNNSRKISLNIEKTPINALFVRGYKALSKNDDSREKITKNFITSRSTGSDQHDTCTTNITMDEVTEKMMEELGLEHGYTPIAKSREYLSKYDPKLEDLPPRCMQDSFSCAIIPLSVDKKIQDRYVSYLGHVRTGRLLEDMDMFAVWVCHRHVHLPKLPENVHLPYTFVTIRVDQVDFTDIITTAQEDVRLSGHVSWVGRSSMEIVVWLEQMQDGLYKKITRALFLMAARNATNTAAAPVNPIEPANDEERKTLSGGLDRKKRRQLTQAQSVFKMEPNDFEQTLMYETFKRTSSLGSLELNHRVLPPNARWMSESFISNTYVAFPEHRNAHRKVFGGFLMRCAVEIAWTSGYLYGKTRPKLKHISDITFDHPVSVNSFIKMTAYVVYTELNYMQIMVVANIIETATGQQVTSNSFYFTLKSMELVNDIYPRTYHEMLWFLQGRRKFRQAMHLD